MGGFPVDVLQQQAGAAFQAGRFADALAACRRILIVQPKRPDVLAFAGTVAMRMGDFGEAARFYADAVRLKPDFVEAHYNRGNALKAIGKPRDAIDSYRRALDLNPELAPAHHNLGSVFQALEDWDEAEACYRRVLEIAPDAADTHRNLGVVMEKSGDLAAAEVAYRAALDLNPGWPLALSNLVPVLFEQGKAGDAFAACDAWLRSVPGDMQALALKAAAFNETGDARGRDALLDYDRFVEVRRWDPPEGYASVDAFNAALAEHVLAHPTLKVPPTDDPTYHHPKLQISEELLAEPHPGAGLGPMAELGAMMEQAVAEYLAARPADAGHPFLANPPAKFRISSWAAVLRGAGNLVPHIHLDGYLSGVYYVRIPGVVASGGGKAGWFELGRPPGEIQFRAEPSTRPIQPEEGLMILFPAYFYHGTIPFDSDEIRISIAFDVVPDR